MHRCVAKGELEIIRLLLQAHALMDLVNSDGKTALELNDHPQIIYMFDEFRVQQAAPAPDEDLFPCEYCEKPFSAAALFPHQFNCSRRS